MLEQLQLIPPGIHIDEIDDDHAADVAQLELTRNFNRRLTVRPKHRFAGVGRTCERSGIHIDHRQGFGGLDDHVATGRKIDPRLERITDRSVDLVMLQQLHGFAVSFDLDIARISSEKAGHPIHSTGVINDDARQIRPHVIPEDPVNEVLITVEQHRWRCALCSLLNSLPLPQQSFEVLNQQLFTDAIGLGSDQQAGSGRLDQHPQSPQAIALGVSTDPARDVHPLAMGLKHEVTPRQGQIPSETRPFGSGGLLHHLHQNLLAGLQQLRDPGGTLFQSQRTEIGDMYKSVLFALADVDEGSINPGQDIFHRAEINITDLIATLGDDQLIDPFIGQHCCDTQLLRDDNVLGHKSGRAHSGL